MYAYKYVCVCVCVSTCMVCEFKVASLFLITRSFICYRWPCLFLFSEHDLSDIRKLGYPCYCGKVGQILRIYKNLARLLTQSNQRVMVLNLSTEPSCQWREFFRMSCQWRVFLQQRPRPYWEWKLECGVLYLLWLRVSKLLILLVGYIPGPKGPHNEWSTLLSLSLEER